MDILSTSSLMNTVLQPTATNSQNSTEELVSSSGKTFQETMLDALNNVNDSVQNVTSLSEQVLVSPDDVDVHEVTIAIAEANMNLNIAKSVIDAAVDAYKEILTLR